jgi:helicase
LAVAGVFVGLSAQDDQRIDALTYGHRDAEALHAHFADANEQRSDPLDQLHLLTNERATAASVREALNDAIANAKAGRADTVIVHFSCHGSLNGDLVLFDADRDDVGGSCVPVREVIELLSRLDNAAAVLSLDCCFSGTALGMQGSLNRDAFDGLMSQMTGDSRFVMWAASPNQKAYEDTALAHGYLSHSLLKELEAARAAGKRDLPIATWLATAVQRIEALAAAAGREQRAGCYGLLTSARTIPVAAVGSYQRQFAETAGLPGIDATLDSLQAHGLLAEDVAAVRSRLHDHATLNQLQQDAVTPHGVLAGRSLLVRAPTSGGKTLIAELAMLRQWRLGRKTVFLLPLRALAHEQSDAVRRNYGDRLGLRVIVSTGEVAGDDDLLRHNQFDVAFLTYEKFTALASARPRFVEDLGVVVLDEIQMIEDPSRGRTLELLLVRLQRLRRERSWPQLIVLCGELANLESLQSWLGLGVVGTVKRPIPLVEGVISPNGVMRTRHPITGDARSRFPGFPAKAKAGRPSRWESDQRAQHALAVAYDVVRTQGKQALFFCFSTWQARRLATWLADDLGLPAVIGLVAALSLADASQEHRARNLLTSVAKKGVAFHIGDLDREERLAVETEFRSGALRVLVATPTLAMGVNSPTDVVVFVDNGIFSYQEGREIPISIPTYRNMAGRAGRLVAGGPQSGTALLVSISEPDAERLWALYIDGVPPALESQLGNLAPEDLAIALLQLQAEATPVQLTEDLGRTYWGFLQNRTDSWVRTHRRRLEESLALLSNEGFAVQSTPGRWALAPRGRTAAAFGLELHAVRRLLRLIGKLRGTAEPIDILTLVVITQASVGIDDVFMPKGTTSATVEVDKRGPLTRRPILWDVLVDPAGLIGDADEYVGNRVHRLLAIIAWLRGGTLADIERQYARASGDEPVAGRFRAMIDRTIDLLPAVAALMVVELPEKTAEIKASFALARHQLAVGGNAAAGQLYALRLKLGRHDCLRLVAEGITDEATLRDALANRRKDVEGILSQVGVEALEQRLDDSRAARRRGPESEQIEIDGFGADTTL